MKILIFATMAALAFLATAEEYKVGPDGCIREADGSLKKFSPEEFLKLPPEVQKAQGKARRLAKLGPTVEKPNAARGYFKYVCCTEAVGREEVQPAVDTILRASKIRLEAVQGKISDFTAAKDALKSLNANAGIFIVENDKLPRVMLAPEDGWAIVNVTALSVDKPDHAKLVKRVNVELVRAFTYICGSTSDNRSLLMQPVATAADLDNIPATFIPFNYQSTEKSLENFGIKPRVVVPYKTAVLQGWAYPPTNDIERAIWKKVQDAKETGPAKAMKITPPVKAKKITPPVKK